MRREIREIFVVQLSVMLLVASFCLFKDVIAAYSAISGGLVCLIPGLYAAIRMTNKNGQHNDGLGTVIIGELGKLMLTIALFVIAFVLIDPLDAMSFFGTFVTLQLVYIAAPLFRANRLRYRRS